MSSITILKRMPQMKEISKKNKLNKLELSRFMIPSILPGNVPTMCSSPQNSTQRRKAQFVDMLFEWNSPQMLQFLLCNAFQNNPSHNFFSHHGPRKPAHKYESYRRKETEKEKELSEGQTLG